MRLAREAVGLSPGLVPAAALAARLLIGQGETRKARKIIETAWDMSQHPDLAKAYLDLRSGDKASERLLRAETLRKMTPDAPEARLCVARAAVEARRFDRARVVLAPLAALDGAERPTVRACIAMAELEEAEHGPGGASREWLARAARAPRDAAWIADGVISDIWSPVSPVTGQLDAFRWERPRENLAAYVYEPPVSEAPASEAPHAAPAVPELSLSPPPAAEPAVMVIEAVPAMPEPAMAKPQTEPVVFPQTSAPDDPGPEEAAAPHRKGLLGSLFGS